MALKPNQLLLTAITTQPNEIIERVHKVVRCQWYAQVICLRIQSGKARITRR
jgi:hypothetical protein